MDKTIHAKKTKHASHHNQKETMVALDNPDDRITEQEGNGETIVKTDSPDDLEDILVENPFNLP